MRILQIYDLDPIHRIGGIEVAIYELSRHLALLGHDVTVISGGDGQCDEQILGSFEAMATNDPFIKAKPKLKHGFMRALLKVPLGRA